MRLSLKLRDETNQGPLLRAKVPITILGMPFLSAVAAGQSSDLMFSLRTNFSSGPSLSVSYRPAPSANPNPNPTSALNPFSVSLKSGIGIFGSSHNSPLVFTANFNLNNSTTTVLPSFSLLVKPQFGNFSLRKLTSSANASINQVGKPALNGNLSDGSGADSDLGNTFCLEKPLQTHWRDLKKGEGYAEINGLLSGILVAAKTSLPVTKSAVVNFRWGVSFPSDGSKMISRPVLMLNKIELERIDEIKKDEEGKKKKNADSSKPDDLDLLKGMCGWMRSELVDLQRQNREMRQTLECSKRQLPIMKTRGEDKKDVSLPSVKSTDFANWRSKKNGGGGEDDRQRDWNQDNAAGSRMSEIESELQKALKANASSS